MVLADSLSLPWWVDLITLIFVLVPVAAVVAGLLSRHRSRVEGAPSTAWATAALVLVRAVAAYIVIGGVLILVSAVPGEQRFGDIAYENGAMTVSVQGTESVLLCASTTVQNIDGPMQLQAPCKASRAIERADPPNTSVQGYLFDLEIQNPTAGEKRRFTLLRVAALGCWLVGLLALERILRRTAKRKPFALDNVVSLRVLAAVVAVAGWLIPASTVRATNALVDKYGDAANNAAMYSRVGGDGLVSWWPLVIAVLVLVMAEVWRLGIRLQAEVEATV